MDTVYVQIFKGYKFHDNSNLGFLRFNFCGLLVIVSSSILVNTGGQDIVHQYFMSNFLKKCYYDAF